MQRALILYFASIKAPFRRLRHDLANEVVALFCSSLIVGLFFYIFQDFLGEKLAVLDATFVAQARRGAAWSILLVAALWAGARIGRERRVEPNFSVFMRTLGEDPKSQRMFLLFLYPTIIALIYAPSYLVACSLFFEVSWLSLPVLLGVTFLAATLYRPFGHKTYKSAVVKTNSRGPVSTLLRWRLAQLLTRNPMGLLLLTLSLATLTAGFYAALTGSPKIVGYVLSFSAGFFASAACLLQWSFDLKTVSLLEQNLGVSHTQFQQSIECMALMLALTCGIASALGWYQEPLFAAQMGLIALTPAFCAPYIVMQIDGKRFGLNLLMTFLISLFLSTALFAHILAAVLLPLVRYYGLAMQKNRFYRAAYGSNHR